MLVTVDDVCFREDPKPEPRAEGSSPVLELVDTGEDSVSVAAEPCSCGNCEEMDSAAENVCCRAETAWQAKYDPEGQCNVLHPPSALYWL